MAEIIWLLEDAVKAIHQRQIAEQGGSPGLRDEGLLKSALARPHNLLAYSEQDPDFAQLAASYAHGIARNHPFIDGNKRTALIAARTFLLLNGRDLEASQEDKYLTFMRLAEGVISEPQLADWIRQNLKT
jgi:death on curing protein